MEFGLVGSSFADHSWKDFVQTALRLGVEAIELDTRANAHCNTWSPDLDPESIVENLRSHNLRVGGLTAWVDLLQEDEEALQREAEAVRGMLDLAFRYRSEIVRLAPQNPKPGWSRQAMLESVIRGCRAFIEHAEENAMLVCLQPNRELLCDAATLLEIIEACESYNLKVTLDVLELLRATRDPERVRAEIKALLGETAHVVLRDGRIRGRGDGIVEVPLGQGDCPVDMVVSELTSSAFYRPFFVAFTGSGDRFEAIKTGLNYFRELPNRILKEMGLL
ncbi:MAG: sugar phosphate isomerase/epimerase family protein [Candidatus Zipacnadales bacterium]